MSWKSIGKKKKTLQVKLLFEVKLKKVANPVECIRAVVPVQFLLLSRCYCGSDTKT